MKILVVDDEAGIRSFVKDLLTRAGHKVTAAASAVEATAHVQMATYDLVLLDVMMPGIDGHQFAQFMVTHWNTFTVPIIVVSGRRDAESKGWAKINGCVRYIEKPFSAGELLDAVREVEEAGAEAKESPAEA